MPTTQCNDLEIRPYLLWATLLAHILKANNQDAFDTLVQTLARKWADTSTPDVVAKALMLGLLAEGARQNPEFGADLPFHVGSFHVGS
jgi:hypothetical protein